MNYLIAVSCVGFLNGCSLLFYLLVLYLKAEQELPEGRNFDTYVFGSVRHSQSQHTVELPAGKGQIFAWNDYKKDGCIFDDSFFFNFCKLQKTIKPEYIYLK